MKLYKKIIIYTLVTILVFSVTTGATFGIIAHTTPKNEINFESPSKASMICELKTKEQLSLLK